MSENFTQKIKEKAIQLMNLWILLILVLLSATLYRTLTKLKSAGQRVERTRQRVVSLKQENVTIEQELKNVQSDYFIEKSIRDRLGLAKEGETIIVLPDDEILKTLTIPEPEEEKHLPDPNWKLWLNLFF